MICPLAHSWGWKSSWLLRCKRQENRAQTHVSITGRRLEQCLLRKIILSISWMNREGIISNQFLFQSRIFHGGAGRGGGVGNLRFSLIVILQFSSQVWEFTAPFPLSICPNRKVIISWLILGQCVFILTHGCLLSGTGSGAPSTYGVNQDARYPTSLQSSLCKCIQHTEEAGHYFLYVLCLCSICKIAGSLLQWLRLNCHHTTQIIIKIVGEAMNLRKVKTIQIKKEPVLLWLLVPESVGNKWLTPTG